MAESICRINECGDKYWELSNKKFHREDGPAIVWNTGLCSWWLNGHYYFSKEQYFEASTKENQEKLLYNSEFMNG